MLTTSVMVADLPEEEKKMPPMPGGGMGDMY
jgi:chaperonin GroEL